MPLHEEHCSKPHCQLTNEELANPYLVIEELFDFAHLPDVRELLWEWLKATVTGSYHRTLSANEQEAIIILFEKLDKLVEAAHKLHETNKNAARKKTNLHKGKKRK